MNEMSAMDYWKLIDSLTVYQAILLMTGEDPNNYDSFFIEERVEDARPKNYTVIKTFLTHAIRDKKIEVLGDLAVYLGGSSHSV